MAARKRNPMRENKNSLATHQANAGIAPSIFE
jgi:hypothetical protein